MGSVSEEAVCSHCGVYHANRYCGVNLKTLWPRCATRIAAINRSTKEDLLTLLAHVPTLPVLMAACLEHELLFFLVGNPTPWAAPITVPSLPISMPRSHSAPCCSYGYMVDKEAPFSTTYHMQDVYGWWNPHVGYLRPLEPRHLPLRFKRVRSATDVRGLYDPDWTEGDPRANPFDSPTATFSVLSSDIAGSDIAPSEGNPQDRQAVIDDPGSFQP